MRMVQNPKTAWECFKNKTTQDSKFIEPTRVPLEKVSRLAFHRSIREAAATAICNHTTDVGFLLKISVITTCVLVCAYQTTVIIHNYLEFPTDVNVIVEQPKFPAVPGITICNGNMMTLTKLKAMENNVEEAFANMPQNLSEEEQRKWMKSILKEYNNYTYFIGKPIRLFAKMGMSKKDFIEQFQCNYNNGTAEVITNQPGSLNYYCQKMPAIKSFQATGHCYTFFHSAAFGGLEQNMNWTDWSVIEEENNEEDCDIGFMNVCRYPSLYRFDPKEILRMRVNFHPEEDTAITAELSGNIAVHDNADIPNTLTNSYYIRPGRYYEVYIRRQTTEMLPPPYETMCKQYEKENIERVKETGDFIRYPMSREACINKCIAEKCLGLCTCWPTEYPYILDNPIDVNRTFDQCTWRLMTESSSNMFKMCYEDFFTECVITCPTACTTDHYDVVVQERGWPSITEIILAEGKEKEELIEKRKCCAEISVRYWTTEHTIHKYKPRYLLLDIFCFIGGLVSMYVGVSIISTYDILVTIMSKGYDLTKKISYPAQVRQRSYTLP